MPLPPEESTYRRLGSDNSLVVRRDTTSGGFNSVVYLTFSEACEYARINRNKMRALLKTGKIPSRKVGRTWIVPRASIDAFMSEPYDRTRIAVRSLVG